MKKGKELDDKFRERTRKMVRENASLRHAPKLILEVADIFKQRSGKIVETTASAIVNGRKTG